MEGHWTMIFSGLHGYVNNSQGEIFVQRALLLSAGVIYYSSYDLFLHSFIKLCMKENLFVTFAKCSFFILFQVSLF